MKMTQNVIFPNANKKKRKKNFSKFSFFVCKLKKSNEYIFLGIFISFFEIFLLFSVIETEQK